MGYGGDSGARTDFIAELNRKPQDKKGQMLGALNMKAVTIRWKLAIPALLAVLAIVYYTLGYTSEIFSRWTDTLRSTDCSTNYLRHPTVQKALYYCNAISSAPAKGLEGEIDRDLYDLELVQVVIRHGDRAPIHTVPNYVLPRIPCRATPELLQLFPEYEEFTRRMSHQNVKRTSNQSFYNWGLFPNAESCTASQLTPEGSAQHVKLGTLMRERYLEKWRLLSSESAWDQVKMISTTKSRTFQSGIAFIYGFLPNLNPRKLHIEAAMDNKMCTKHTKFQCSCPAITRNIDLMGTSFKQTSPEFVHQKAVRSAYEDMAVAMRTEPREMPRATHVFDINMVHACHGLPLPGLDGKCWAPRALVNLVAAVNANGVKNVKSTLWKTVARLKMLPLLNDIYKRIQGLAENKTRERFVLYSGHDTTIDPLTASLGINSGAWSPYASRLVIETYGFRHAQHKHYLLRFLFNGKDVTPRVIFCRPESEGQETLNTDGMCSFDDFEEWIENESLKDLHPDKTYRQLCAENIL